MAVYMPYNPVSYSKSFKVTLSLFVVEGWAFFTRNAREPNLYIYKIDSERNLKVLDFQRNTSFKNFFGISRAARSLSVEIGGLLIDIDSSKWSKNEEKSITKQFLKSETFPVTNEAINPVLTDTIFLEYKEKVPWAWIKSYDSITMSSKTIKLYVLPKENY
ncbi:SdpA family antimicrobial peptide system protein [Tenacibaculum litopenaei]|uniref:SdpA family antimicrobial peptide system protein n=1 Tax=Tenacibaculum litopenaei TaxID=396016 RepID=UPI0038B50E0C